MSYLNISTRHNDRPLLLLTILLSVIGTVMLYSASSSRSLDMTQGLTDTYYLFAHVKRLVLGLGVMFIFMILDYRRLKPLAIYFVFISIFLLLFTKISYIVQGDSSPARWLKIGSLGFQTSDVARISLILFLAAYVDHKRSKLKNFNEGLLPPLIILGTVVGLIVLQPDFSTAFMLGAIGILMLFLGGARMTHLALTGLIALVGSIPVMLLEPYRRARIMAYFAETNETTESGYQAYQSLISLGNGGMFGLGLGNSLEKNLFLPTPHTDFIFAIIGEELGLLGAFAVLTVFLLIFHRGIQIAKNTTDPFGVMLAVGISFNLIFYAFINVAVVTNILPVTGLPMPLISYGGSGTLINLAAIGILLNISQSKRSIYHRQGWQPKPFMK